MVSNGTVQLSRGRVGDGRDGELRKFVDGITCSWVSLKLLGCEST